METMHKIAREHGWAVSDISNSYGDVRYRRGEHRLLIELDERQNVSRFEHRVGGRIAETKVDRDPGKRVRIVELLIEHGEEVKA
ncbi:MAG TPA: hypothetical protein VKY71_03425 [Actinotalea caeni]|uniref:hypothetical protein n=1 Tax=Actinotalea caeni TaxID=1348467 RepID=UPI002B4B3E8D|nr:hypothetical protein [Actinotalea caeni]HLV54608.1 hypothetical protein [Actinotalea caeni]